MKVTHIFLAAIFGLASLQASAQGMSSHSHMGHEDTKASAKQVPFVKAEVRKVDAKAGKVTLKHEDIKNLDMPSMTMAFPVANKKLLNGLKAGDQVRVKFENVKGQATVVALEAAK